MPYFLAGSLRYSNVCMAFLTWDRSRDFQLRRSGSRSLDFQLLRLGNRSLKSQRGQSYLRPRLRRPSRQLAIVALSWYTRPERPSPPMFLSSLQTGSPRPQSSSPNPPIPDRSRHLQSFSDRGGSTPSERPLWSKRT